MTLKVVTIGAVIFLLGGVLQTATPNKEMMLAGRFFAGMGIGALASHLESLLSGLV
jgi:predicted MFS family arabinose efflux permease